VICERQEVDA
jgi:hypothetical protein